MEVDKAAEGAVVGKPPVFSTSKHINKRSLRNKSLSISFDENDLRNFVSGFHKRKKKRRKEALKQQQKVEQRKRLEERKKRRLAKAYALNGGAPPVDDAECDGDDLEEIDEVEPNASVAGTATYDNGDVMVTVTMSEISREEVEHRGEKPASLPPPVSTEEARKKHNITVSKKQTFKKSTKGKFRPKLQKKRDKRKAKINNTKRH